MVLPVTKQKQKSLHVIRCKLFKILTDQDIMHLHESLPSLYSNGSKLFPIHLNFLK